MGTSKQSKNKPKVHKDLDGFEVSIDAFGELKSSLDIDQLNKFLKREVVDIEN